MEPCGQEEAEAFAGGVGTKGNWHGWLPLMWSGTVLLFSS